MNMGRDNREEFEREYLAYLINDCELIEISNIRPEYLHTDKLKKLLKDIIYCYKKYKTISVEIFKTLYDEEKKEIDIELYVELSENQLYTKHKEKQFKLCEEFIIKYYKEDIIKNMGDKLNKKEITYDKYVERIKKLDSIKINEQEKEILNIKDIDMKDKEETRILSNTQLLDKATKGFTLGQLSVWSGSNASAKSTYLNQIAIESMEQGYNVAIYSGELIPRRLIGWIINQCAGKNNMKYNKNKDYWYVEDEKKERIMKWLNKKLFLYNNKNGNKSSQVINTLQKCVDKENVKVIIIDNLMSLNLEGENKYDLQSELITKLSEFAKNNNVHIHFVCHPRKVTSFLRKIDISGSSDLSNIADNIFIMHRVNNDFKLKTKEMYKWKDDAELYKYTNVVEVCKNRDFGVEDYFVGMYFETESKRLLDYENEDRHYKWEFEW